MICRNILCKISSRASPAGRFLFDYPAREKVEVMGRTAKHNWAKLFLEYNQGRYKSAAEFHQLQKNE
jgi:hypothetical protein